MISHRQPVCLTKIRKRNHSNTQVSGENSLPSEPSDSQVLSKCMCTVPEKDIFPLSQSNRFEGDPLANSTITIQSCCYDQMLNDCSPQHLLSEHSPRGYSPKQALGECICHQLTEKCSSQHPHNCWRHQHHHECWPFLLSKFNHFQEEIRFKDYEIVKRDQIIRIQCQEIATKNKQLFDLEKHKQMLLGRQQECQLKIQSQQLQKQEVNYKVNQLELAIADIEKQYQNIITLNDGAQRFMKEQVDSVKNNSKDLEQNIKSKTISSQDYISVQFQDWEGKARDYKRQMEVEKNRRINLQRELKQSHENARITNKLQIEGLQNRIYTLRQQLQSKATEVKDKENMIHRLMKKN